MLAPEMRIRIAHLPAGFRSASHARAVNPRGYRVRRPARLLPARTRPTTNCGGPPSTERWPPLESTNRRRARVRSYAIRTLHSAGLAYGSGRDRPGQTLGGDAGPGGPRRRRRVGLVMGLRPLPHRADADRRSDPRGVVADVGLRGDYVADQARPDVHGDELSQSGVPG